jgi:hypothetical protein
VVAAPVVLGAGQVVATVNGVPLTGRDLLAFSAGGPPERSLTSEMFAFLRQRAIERELVLQEARVQRVELGPPQIEQLAKVRPAARERGVSDPNELDFEELEARTDMLKAVLAESVGGVAPPFATASDVDRYFEAHAAELGVASAEPSARARARQELDTRIRELLAKDIANEYKEQLERYMTRLRSEGHITLGDSTAH